MQTAIRNCYNCGDIIFEPRRLQQITQTDILLPRTKHYKQNGKLVTLTTGEGLTVSEQNVEVPFEQLNSVWFV